MRNFLLILAGIVLFWLITSVAFVNVATAWVATVSFTAPSDSTHCTCVLVSETSGDYSQSYGQISEPGETTVQIGNIKPETQYYFIAYLYDPVTNMRSGNSNEVAYLTAAYLPPELIELPPLVFEGTTVTITIKMD